MFDLAHFDLAHATVSVLIVFAALKLLGDKSPAIRFGAIFVAVFLLNIVWPY
uniref:hypothetical protein n=1 Tax=uncultured Altererythrobacter sp. TaxID=500840 RepID=UPI0026124ED3|nr:hypothetical protein [uncultured Altererythrobacter sp.]